jgi:hypothetical protein
MDLLFFQGFLRFRGVPSKVSRTSGYTKGRFFQGNMLPDAENRGLMPCFLSVFEVLAEPVSNPRPYREEGPDYYQVRDKDRVKDKLVQRLRKLGYAVTVTAAEPAA